MNYRNAMEESLKIATQSPDPSTQNGAVLVDSLGYVFAGDCNRFPDGVQYNPDRWLRPGKYQFIEHAERNAIFAAARKGESTEGSTMVCAWAACSDCARAIVQAGIAKLVRFPAEIMNAGSDPRWHQECEVGDVILIEGGVEIVEQTFPDIAIEVRRNGQLWHP
jgi:dCMP deaminase